jgi:predicted kinase
MKAILTVGISASGKSTWSESQNNVVVINRDDMRWAISGCKGWNRPNAYRFNSVVEKSVTLLNDQKLFECADEGLDVIIADTNLNPHLRNKLIARCKELGYDVEIKEFPITFQEACRRDKERGIFAVGEEVLKKQWESWIEYHKSKGEGQW